MEGKALGRDFIVRLIKSGVKPSISGDLWSEGVKVAWDSLVYLRTALLTLG